MHFLSMQNCTTFEVRRLKKSIFKSLSNLKTRQISSHVVPLSGLPSINFGSTSKGKEKVIDVPQQHPFKGYNISSEGPTQLLSSFSEWIHESLTSIMHKNKAYVLVNCDGEFNWILTIVILNERCIIVCKLMLLLKRNRNKILPSEIQKLATIDCRLFVVEFLIDRLQARSGYVSNNEDPHRLSRPKKSNFIAPNENEDLVSLVGPSFKNFKLVALLNDKKLSKNLKESLCLV
ncbi:hypothetical protein H5410_045922 [Solanum commersonii]|uniref:Uncharacterized protein n=1 Tax=Solanum commersonii TaxID=4109 RepID=A0A9J5XF20_SOLCO|nr:hypothetical protein H5410_045922 [Solanum commersonii]